MELAPKQPFESICIGYLPIPTFLSFHIKAKYKELTPVW